MFHRFGFPAGRQSAAGPLFVILRHRPEGSNSRCEPCDLLAPRLAAEDIMVAYDGLRVDL